ncbi:hypothetical protein ACWIID_17050 [Streptomyces phaeochromogenes]
MPVTQLGVGGYLDVSTRALPGIGHDTADQPDRPYTVITRLDTDVPARTPVPSSASSPAARMAIAPYC